MVDISSQEKKINIKIQSGGVQANVGITQDTAQYYSEKAREWAISNRIVDGVDYSSKYYAEKSNQSALNAQSFAQSAQDSYNDFQQSVDGALGTVNDTVQGAITTIDTKSGEAIETINNTVDGVIEDIETEANEQIANIERTGFYMRDDKLYFINSQGVEEEFKSGSENAANLDLSNLSEIGEKHFLGKSQITNCIKEIPQRLNLVVENDVLVLKAGSIVTIPDGFEDDGVTRKFQHLTIDRDRTCGNVYSATTAIEIYYIAEDHPDQEASASDGLTTRYVGYSYSSDTAPTGVSAFWYDFANNVIKQSRDNGATWAGKYSLPIGKAWPLGDGTNKFKSVAMWQGIGYMGTTVWLDKDVKALLPNGRNEDGTLKNYEVTTDNVLIVTDTLFNADGKYYAMLNKNEDRLEIARSNISITSYDYTTNLMYRNDGLFPNSTPIAVVTVGNSRVTRIEPKYPFAAVNYNDFNGIKAYLKTAYVSGKSGYNIWSNGYCEQWGETAYPTTITLAKTYGSSNYSIMLTKSSTAAGGNYQNLNAIVQSGNKFKIAQSDTSYASRVYWKTCGYLNASQY